MEQLAFQFNNPHIQKLFQYHAANPHIYEMFKRYTFEATRSGYKHFGSQMIIEKIRWETGVVAQNSEFKIDNNMSPFYARLFMDEFPQHSGLFRTRSSVTDGAFI
jgi:hypothetical protein